MRAADAVGNLRFDCGAEGSLRRFHHRRRLEQAAMIVTADLPHRSRHATRNQDDCRPRSRSERKHRAGADALRLRLAVLPDAERDACGGGA